MGCTTNSLASAFLFFALPFSPPNCYWHEAWFTVGLKRFVYHVLCKQIEVIYKILFSMVYCFQWRDDAIWKHGKDWRYPALNKETWKEESPSRDTLGDLWASYATVGKMVRCSVYCWVVFFPILELMISSCIHWQNPITYKFPESRLVCSLKRIEQIVGWI